MMGEVAELERTLIRGRIKSVLRSGRAQGRVGDDPVLRAGDREAIRKLRTVRNDSYLRKLEATAKRWLPLVRRHRPPLLERIWHVWSKFVLASPWPV